MYDIYHCCVYSEKLQMMDRGTVPKYAEVYSKNKFEKLVYLVGFITRIYQQRVFSRTWRPDQPLNPITLLFNGYQ
jgi:hypothetical protein